MQLGGLATGMDTAALIDQLVALEQKPILNYEQEISEIKQTKGAWRDVNSRLDKLENRTTDLKMSSTFNSRSASSSNKDVVTATASNDADETNYSVTVNQVATSQRLIGRRKKDFSASKEGDTISLNGSEISVSDGDSLSDISNNINKAETGYKASVIDNVLVLEAEETGKTNALSVGTGNSEGTISDKNGILKELGIIDANNTFTNEKEATDAEIEINGIKNITSSNNTFSDAVEGVTFNINPDAVDNEGDTALSNVSVTKDRGKSTDAVQAFVDQYNSVMNFIDGKTDYDEDTEKASVLQGDSTAIRLQNRLRNLATSQVKDNGQFKTLTSVGIEIDRDGVMSFDKEKFTAALDESSEEVMSLFNADSSDKDDFDGMAVRMDGYLDQLMQSNTGLIPRRLDFYDNRIDSLNDDIEAVERKVEMTRARYTEQFTNMETAISEMNQQMSWMQSQLSSLGGSGGMMSGI